MKRNKEKEEVNCDDHFCELYVREEDLCAVLGISKWTLYQWARHGKIPAYKASRGYQFRRDEIISFINKHKVQPWNL